MGITGRGVLASIAMAAGLALAAPGGAAATGWSPPAFPIPGALTATPAVAVNAQGDVALAAATASGVLVTVRPAGGAFATPVALGAGNVNGVSAAIDDAGDLAVAWSTAPGIAHLAVRPAGGAFGAIHDFPNAAGAFDRVDVAIADDGDVAFAWSVTEGGKTLLKNVIRSPDGTLGAVGTSAAGQSIGPSFELAMSAAGDAALAWTRTNGTNFLAQATTRAAGGAAFGAPVTLSAPGEDAVDAVADVDEDGRAVVAWMRVVGSYNRIQVAYRPSGGLFTLPVEASPDGGHGMYPSIALADDGEVVASWTGPGSKATSRVGQFGAPFAAPAAQFDTGGAHTVTAVAPDGRAVVVWGVAAGGVMAAARAPGGAFGAPAFVTSPVFTSANVVYTPIAMSATGDAVLTWAVAPGAGFTVLDATAPELRSLSVPGTATAGGAAGFSVAPFDAFSAVQSVTWEFGDGSAPATGGSVAHTFGAAGNYTVKVTATDAEGNAASATRTVAVAAAAAGATPPNAPPPLPPPPAPTCKVPKLTGLTYARAKAKLVKARCRMGSAKKPKGRKTTKNLVVKSQSRKAGATTQAGAKVNVTLGAKAKPKKKAGRR